MASKLSDLKDKAKSAVNKKLGISDSAALTKIHIGAYEAYLNPNQLSHSIKVAHTEPDKAAMPKAESSETNTIVKPSIPTSTEPETLSFELMIDGTGATGQEAHVPTEITRLAKAVFDPLADPNERAKGIVIEWGTIISFTGHIQSFDTTYTLFKPDGTPLRATVKLAFQGSSNLTKVVKEVDRGKTKEVDIDAAKTIVNACTAVYNSPVAYIAVAKANKLTNVRKLKPGSKLIFPPKKD